MSFGSPGNLSFAPRLHWSDMDEGEHFVQFCESDEFLVHSVSGFVGSALARGEAGLVVATPPHRDGIERALADLGLDLEQLSAEGRYVSLDALDTLESLKCGGVLDEARFEEEVGRLISRMTGSGLRLRIFGEMVALLVDAGDKAGAVRLEELWNGIAKKHRFSLFCAYPVSAELDASALGLVCRQHSGVIPGESFSALDSGAERMRAIVGLQQRVAALGAEIQKRSEIERAFLNRLRTARP
jgi:hypothetical protein